MVYKDIQQFMRHLEQKQLLRRVAAPVSPVLEIAEITRRVMEEQGPALLFEQVRGARWPLLAGALGSRERICLALGGGSLEDTGAEIAARTGLSGGALLGDKAKASPVKVRCAPCQEVVEEGDLRSLPLLKSWPEDAGRCVPSALVFTRDPDTGRQQTEVCRMQAYDARTAGIRWPTRQGEEGALQDKYRRQGGKMPVSAAIGCDPATLYALRATLAPRMDRLLFAGYLRKRPVPMVRCITNGIWVPAHSEFVLEGYVDTNEPLRREGPFGESAGCYCQPEPCPVFHLVRITRKNRPVFVAGAMEDCAVAKVSERLFLPLLQMMAPEITDWSFPLEEGLHGCVIVSIHKQYPAHARRILHTLWGLEQTMWIKTIIVVDKEVNPHDLAAVAGRVLRNVGKGDLLPEQGATGAEAPGGRVGVDATRKWPTEGYPSLCPGEARIPRAVQELVQSRWKQYGL